MVKVEIRNPGNTNEEIVLVWGEICEMGRFALKVFSSVWEILEFQNIMQHFWTKGLRLLKEKKMKNEKFDILKPYEVHIYE